MKIKRKSLLAIAAALCGVLGVMGQPKETKPRLVVGIVVDQMRWDYLHRFGARFGNGGFNRLLNEGFSCDNTQLNYIPTITAIGHTSIYTGSVPSIHGIAGNDFYKDGKRVYCTSDSTVSSVGTKNESGQMSPKNLLVTTIGDELKLSNNFRSKVIGISLKDRASILPAGHTSNAAYWFDDETGNFVTSSYYMDRLPEWVKEFNKNQYPQKLLMQEWNTLYPINTYKESSADNNPYEKSQIKGEAPVLPLMTSTIFQKKGYKAIRATPYGNTLTFKMAEEAIKAEKLGQGQTTDMITVSLSSTDYIGHQFGTYAIETEDTYLRLDKDLENFLGLLDNKVGKGNYLVFLTADHAATHNFTFMQANRLPAGGWVLPDTKKKLDKFLKKEFDLEIEFVKDILNYQVFMNKEEISAHGIDCEEVISKAIAYLKKDKTFAYVLDMNNLKGSSVPNHIIERAVNGYNWHRSGDIQLIVQPGYYDIESPEDKGGTEHGVWNPYDSHIPLIFMGWGIRNGSTSHPVNVTDIAPTVCSLLNIQMPNGCIGTPIIDILGQ